VETKADSTDKKDSYAFVSTLWRVDSEVPGRVSKLMQASIGLDEILFDLVRDLIPIPFFARRDNLITEMGKKNKIILPDKTYAKQLNYPELPEIQGLDILIDGSDGPLICKPHYGSRSANLELSWSIGQMDPIWLPGAFHKAEESLNALHSLNLVVMIYDSEGSGMAQTALPGRVCLTYSRPGSAQVARYGFQTDRLDGDLTLLLAPAADYLAKLDKKNGDSLASILEGTFRVLCNNL